MGAHGQNWRSGADVILASPAERDRVRGRHTDWLSSHPAGL
ncbi:hypothetical protein [Streptomyces sp. NPDC096311]